MANKKVKETKAQRKERLELLDSLITQVIPDKQKYNRKKKHKKEQYEIQSNPKEETR